VISQPVTGKKCKDFVIVAQKNALNTAVFADTGLLNFCTKNNPVCPAAATSRPSLMAG